MEETELSIYLRSKNCELTPLFTGCLYNGMGLIPGTPGGPPAPTGWELYDLLAEESFRWYSVVRVEEDDTMIEFIDRLFERMSFFNHHIKRDPECILRKSKMNMIRFGCRFPEFVERIRKEDYPAYQLYQKSLREEKLKKILCYIQMELTK